MAWRMGKIMTWCTGLALAGAVAGCGQPAVRVAGSWGRAIEVPGLGALNKGRDAEVSSVSCGSAGSCVAGGVYTDGDRHRQGFVAGERNGVWGQAIEVPGLNILNAGGSASVSSVSCGSAGNCAAGGDYTDGDRHWQGFVADERNGRWGTAVEVPGLSALNKGNAGVLSVSCASAGNCVAAGEYTDGDRHGQGFVADERNGVWGQAIGIPGLNILNAGGSASVSSVSCGSPGNCAAGGSYAGGGDSGQGFVADERDGIWGTAIEVPGLAARNKGGSASVDSVSCTPAGGCAAGGDYTDRGQEGHGFVADERNGAWGQAIDVPAPTNENIGVGPVSCASAGNCAAGGATDPYGSGFVVSEKNGVWGQANDVPGLWALNKGRSGAAVESVSCGSPGNCAAAGHYADTGENLQGFVAVERNGRWAKAIEVPGLADLNKGDVLFSEVSCAPAGGCAVGGSYQDRRGQGHFQGFVVSQIGQGG
jgi:cytochrome c551/c552